MIDVKGIVIGRQTYFHFFVDSVITTAVENSIGIAGGGRSDSELLLQVFILLRKLVDLLLKGGGPVSLGAAQAALMRGIALFQLFSQPLVVVLHIRQTPLELIDLFIELLDLVVVALLADTSLVWRLALQLFDSLFQSINLTRMAQMDVFELILEDDDLSLILGHCLSTFHLWSKFKE